MKIARELYERMYGDLSQTGAEYELFCRRLKQVMAPLEGREDFEELDEICLEVSSCSQESG